MHLDATGYYFKISRDTIRAITRLHREGLTIQEICEELKIERKTVKYHLRGLGLFKRRQIQNRSLFLLFHKPRDRSEDAKARRQVFQITNRMLDSLGEQELFRLYRLTASNHALRQSFLKGRNV